VRNLNSFDFFFFSCFVYAILITDIDAAVLGINIADEIRCKEIYERKIFQIFYK